ncbi:Crp/Fnr family transcriptional regulator [Flagellimonas okinawensis]|uniref:Crp/Fnr family transcriptional regulator n=1 Tax=Flagellimonas okinawensis TaxID=3031324 RepID=A0ABT5XRN9_9FLAO|nr:Crp/Fnr family transcriptional regulator [[Muricauda] okinawensis]MDF0708470.1 Crp/Fnr family transcriptional regulator [[Muricauda] okinawensis]
MDLKADHQKYLAAYLEHFSHLSKEEQDLFSSQLNFKKYNPKEFFFKNGETQKNMGFVCQGLLRRYYINDKGKSITTGFVKENEYATDYPAFIQQRPSKYYMECLEPCLIIEFSYDDIQNGYRNFKSHEKYGRLIAEKVLTIQTDRVESFLFETAEERYLNFIQEHSDLLNRISLTHLSSYLGIERQSLSRIRSKIAKK